MLTNYAFSQLTPNKLAGSWVNYKVEMVDSTKNLNKLNYIKFDINWNKMGIYYDPIHKPSPYYSQSYFNYKLENNVLKTSHTSGYLVEYFSNDTLIIAEKIDGIAPNKRKRYYLMNEKFILAQKLKETKELKTLRATPDFTPKLNSYIGFDAHKLKILKENSANFYLAGDIIIYPKERSVKAIIKESTATEEDAFRVKFITKIINDSFKNWDLTNFENFEEIEIPFLVRVKTIDYARAAMIEYF